MWRGKRPGASSGTLMRRMSSDRAKRCAIASTAAAQAVFVDGEAQLLGVRTPLDLDEGDDAAALDDKGHFPARRLHSPSQDAPTFQPEIPAGQGFASAPAPLRFRPPAAHLSSSARA